MTKTMKVEGPMHVICQCDKCKPQISFNAEVIGYVEPQREWVGLTDEQFVEAVRLAEDGNYLLAFQRIQQWLKETNA